MLNDHFPEFGTPPIAQGYWPFVLHLYVPDADASWAKALAAGCTVAFPLADPVLGQSIWAGEGSVRLHLVDCDEIEGVEGGNGSAPRRKCSAKRRSSLWGGPLVRGKPGRSALPRKGCQSRQESRPGCSRETRVCPTGVGCTKKNWLQKKTGCKKNWLQKNWLQKSWLPKSWCRNLAMVTEAATWTASRPEGRRLTAGTFVEVAALRP